MLVFVTYPLIFAVSFWAFQVGIMPGHKNPLVVMGWLALTVGLVVALAFTGCRDPGIFYRHARPPPQVRRLCGSSTKVATAMTSDDIFLRCIGFGLGFPYLSDLCWPHRAE